MKLGLIARADNTGLGNQTWEFYKHMYPVKTMVVDISAYNNNKQYPERYDKDCMFITGFPADIDVREFLDGLDVVFIAEAAYNPNLYNIAQEMGVKTAVQYNYEFMDWLVNPDYPKPDMLIAPSKWHYDEVDAWCKANGVKHVYLHCPVNRELLPFREIKQARKFLHIAGKPAANDRNGTKTVLAASKHLQTDAEIVVHFQGEQGLPHQQTETIADYVKFLYEFGDPEKVTIEQIEFDNYADAYKEGDVLLLPRRYGGNCLPMNEALSCGMPVLMPRISPNDEFLPPNWLLPAELVGHFQPRTPVDIYGVDPIMMANAIDVWHDSTPEKFLACTTEAERLANAIDWKTQQPEYQKVLEDLCNL